MTHPLQGMFQFRRGKRLFVRKYDVESNSWKDMEEKDAVREIHELLGERHIDDLVIPARRELLPAMLMLIDLSNDEVEAHLANHLEELRDLNTQAILEMHRLTDVRSRGVDVEERISVLLAHARALRLLAESFEERITSPVSTSGEDT